MTSVDKEIGQLQEVSKKASTDITTLFESNENRKEQIHKIELKLLDIQHTVEETNTTTNHVAESMEKLTKEFHDYMKKMDARMTAMEASRFDIVKVLKWLGTTRGLIFMVFLIGVLNPASQDFIIELFGQILGNAKAAP